METERRGIMQFDLKLSRGLLKQQERKINHFFNRKIKEYVVRGGVWLISYFPFFKKEIKNLFKDFKDYRALKETLVLNLHSTYFIQNFNTIKEWLYSKEFKENYQDKNHPYPSLLNPNKIDYESIPAELAWEMNLALPPYYEFIFVLLHGAGGTSMTHYLELCGVNLNRHWGNGDFQYQDSYKLLMKNKTLINGVIVSSSNYDGTRDKHIKLVNKEALILCIVRDPISILKHIINHKKHSIKKSLRNFGLDTPMQNLFDFKIMTRNVRLGLDFLIKDYSNDCKETSFYVNDFLNQASKICYIPMEDIIPPKTYDTLLFLSKELGFSKPKKFAAFERKINSANHYSDEGFFPRTFQVSTAHNIQIHLEITKEQDEKQDFVECIKLFSQSGFLINEIKARVYCSKEHFTLLSEEKELLNKVKTYLTEYFVKMEEFYHKEKAKLVNEKDILEYLKKDKDTTLAYKKSFDKEYAHLKATRPDIVASWKYYQEFERMCEELDGK